MKARSIYNIVKDAQSTKRVLLQLNKENKRNGVHDLRWAKGKS